MIGFIQAVVMLLVYLALMGLGITIFSLMFVM